MKNILRILMLCGLIAVPVSLQSGNLGTGSKACPTSGRAQLSATVTKASWVSIQAPTANTGTVYVGGSAVVVTTSGNGIQANGTVFMPPLANTQSYDLSQTFIACTANTDSVTYLYQQ